MNIEAWRRHKGLTLEQAAAKFGCSAATVSRLERAKQSPSVNLIRRISLATDGQVQPNDFFKDSQAA